jgi:hypothetical protein
MATMRATERRKVAEEQHLAMANRHITEATERIARQSALIGRIAAAGWDTSLSERLLQEMERALGLIYVHRAQIMRELSGLSRSTRLRPKFDDRICCQAGQRRRR